MLRVPPLLTGCVLVGVIACATAWAWLHITGARALTPGAVVVCTIASVAVALAVEQTASVVRARRRRAALPARHRKAGA